MLKVLLCCSAESLFWTGVRAGPHAAALLLLREQRRERGHRARGVLAGARDERAQRDALLVEPRGVPLAAQVTAQARGERVVGHEAGEHQYGSLPGVHAAARAGLRH